MKRILSSLVVLSLVTTTSYADCSFTDLVHNPDGTVTYSKADHICVGQLVQDNATKTKQVQDLMKAVSLKDVAIQTADKRADDWMNTSLKLEENVQKVDSIKKTNEWVYFGLGVLTVVTSGIVAAQLTNRH